MGSGPCYSIADQKYLAQLRRNEEALLRRRQDQRKKALAKTRAAKALIVADAVIELISRVVIRPGPKPEERECTDVARELTALRKQIAGVVLKGGSTEAKRRREQS